MSLHWVHGSRRSGKTTYIQARARESNLRCYSVKWAEGKLIGYNGPKSLRGCKFVLEVMVLDELEDHMPLLQALHKEDFIPGFDIIVYIHALNPPEDSKFFEIVEIKK
jgi:hypothetical protein